MVLCEYSISKSSLIWPICSFLLTGSLTWINLNPSPAGITCAFPNLNDYHIEVWKWISIFIPHCITDVISCPCWDPLGYVQRNPGVTRITTAKPSESTWQFNTPWAKPKSKCFIMVMSWGLGGYMWLFIHIFQGCFISDPMFGVMPVNQPYKICLG